MQIGSFSWRIKNYGLKAGLFYFLDKFNRTIRENPKQILNDMVFFEKKFSVNDSKIDIQEMYSEIKTSFEFIKSELRSEEIKNVFDNPSFTRVLVIGMLVKSRKFSQLIETGTQNGISAFLVSKLNKKYRANLKIHSFDVINQPKITDDSVQYYVLDRKVRKGFCQLTSTINLPGTIFFHDSDHSNENMSFEFDWAWNHLQVEALVSDDIESNNAFSDFCRVNSLTPYYFKLDSGPIVGMVLRN